MKQFIFLLMILSPKWTYSSQMDDRAIKAQKPVYHESECKEDSIIVVTSSQNQYVFHIAQLKEFEPKSMLLAKLNFINPSNICHLFTDDYPYAGDCDENSLHFLAEYMNSYSYCTRCLYAHLVSKSLKDIYFLYKASEFLQFEHLSSELLKFWPHLKLVDCKILANKDQKSYNFDQLFSAALHLCQGYNNFDMCMIQEAIDLGFADAVYRFGYSSYLQRIDTDPEKNSEKNEIDFIEEAANKGHVDAQYHLGELYLKGAEVEQNLSEAKYYLDLASSQNHHRAMFLLGGMCMHGRRVDKDYHKAKDFFEKAIALGNVESKLSLGLLYLKGHIEDHESCIKGKYFIEQAALQNYPLALYYLGKLYLRGRINGFSKDYSKAKAYFLKAASANNLASLYYLGEIYFKGLGVPKDEKKALKLFIKAAKQKHTESLYCIGAMYFNGQGGLSRNVEKSRIFFEISASNHYPPAIKALKKIEDMSE